MRNGLGRNGGWLALVLLSAGSTAYAMPPIVPEQLLCSSPYVFVGRVLSAVNNDCRLAKPSSQCASARRNDVQLEVVVTRVLGIRPDLVKGRETALRAGDMIKPVATALAAPYRMEKHDGQGGLAFTAPYESILPDEVLKAAYVGQEFVFSGGAHFVHTWPMARTGWALQTMTDSARLSGASPCQTPL